LLADARLRPPVGALLADARRFPPVGALLADARLPSLIRHPRVPSSGTPTPDFPDARFHFPPARQP